MQVTRTPLSGTGFGYADDMTIRLQNTLTPETFQYVNEFRRHRTTRTIPLELSEEQSQDEQARTSTTPVSSSTEGDDSAHSSESMESVE